MLSLTRDDDGRPDASAHLRPAFGAELGAGRKRHTAVGASPRPDLFRAAARRAQQRLRPWIWRAVLAQAASGAPARPAAHPLRAARALHELGTGLLHRFLEGLVVGLLPTGCAPALSGVGRGGEHAPQQAAGGVEDAAHGSRRPGADPGAEAGRAPVAVEFELKALLGAQVGVVDDEFDLSVHDAPCRSRELALCLYELFTAEIADSPE